MFKLKGFFLFLKSEIGIQMKLQSDYLCLLKLCFCLQEILRREDRHLFCVAGVLHSDAGPGSSRGPGLLSLWIRESKQLHLEVTRSFLATVLKADET